MIANMLTDTDLIGLSVTIAPYIIPIEHRNANIDMVKFIVFINNDFSYWIMKAILVFAS